MSTLSIPIQLQFASYAAGLQNTTTYLQENATDTDWLSLSPSVFFSVYAFVWSVNGGSGDFGNYSVNSDGGVRPAISLIISTTISGGTGTSEDPYVVN